MTSTRALRDHFLNDMNVLGIDHTTLPLNLFFTYCGDILGSSGEHYAKGSGHVTLEKAANTANTHYSDDFAESLAMHLLSARRWEPTLLALMAGRDEFLAIIREHYIAYGLQYSPWAAALFEEKIVDRYGILLANHDGCGAAMRAAALAPHTGIDYDTLLPFFLITHANAQAVEGAYMVWGFARAALARKPYPLCLHQAMIDGEEGRKRAVSFLQREQLPVCRDHSVSAAWKKALDTQDPYVNLKDISKEGVDTHFVVTSAFLILHEIQNGRAEKGKEAAYVVERGLQIGGDPDTICSISMGLAGLMDPASFHHQLAGIEIRIP